MGIFNLDTTAHTLSTPSTHNCILHKRHNTMKRLHLIIILSLLSFTAATAQQAVHPTRYNWINVATTITEGCTNDYERVEAIYKWICANISYDTSMSIYHADECWDNKRGVCQAYSELFYYIAQALNIRVDIITGHSKDILGNSGGHAWIYAETNKERHAGVLIDPTWGAGSVKNGVFERSDNDMSWFHVSPYLMVCTHFPEDASYQLLDTPISREQFYRLPPLYPELETLGLDAQKIFEHCKRNPDKFPLYYSNDGNPPFYIEDIPLLRTLRPGHTYRFSIRKRDTEFTIICDGKWIHSKDWQYNNGVYTLDYTVPCGESLKISWYDKRKNTYYTTFHYDIATPTPEERRRLEEIAQQEAANSTSGAGRNNEQGTNFSDMFNNAVNEGGSTTSPPTFYSKELVNIIDIPMNGTLKAGRSYKFRIEPKCIGKWAVINNHNWEHNWTISHDGKELEITFTPASGKLEIAVQKEIEGSYHVCIEYNVE